MNTNKPNNTDITKRAKDLIDKTGKASKIVENTAHSVTESANSISKLSEKLDEMDMIYINAGLSPNAQRMVDMYIQRLEKGNLTPEAEQKILEAIHRIVTDDIEGITRKTESRSKLNRSQGVKVAGYGVGIGVGALGTGYLIKTLFDLFGNNNNNNNIRSA